VLKWCKLNGAPGVEKVLATIENAKPPAPKLQDQN